MTNESTRATAAPADLHTVIEFALELGERENADAALNFLSAWNWETDDFVRAQWPEFAARELDVEAERRAFEALAQQRGLNVTRSASNPERYRFDRTGIAWEFWLIGSRASRQATAESAPASAAPDETTKRLLRAAKVYAFNYMQDEAESEDGCVCGPKQHAEAKEVFKAIHDFEQAIAPSNNSPVGAKESK